MGKIKKQILRRLRSRGKPQLAVLRNDLSKTDWSIRLATGAEILPFLTAAAAALEDEEDGLSQRENEVTPHMRGVCTSVWPVYDPQANDKITRSEKKLLDFLKDARVLPRGAGLEQLCQWGHENDLPFRLDLTIEGSQLWAQEVTKDLIPGVSLTRFVRGTAQCAAQAVNQNDLGLDPSQPIKRSEQRLLTHLQHTGKLSLGADLAELCRWGRANGLYRRVDLQTAGNALHKSGITITLLVERGRPAVQGSKSGRVEKSTAQKAKHVRRLGTDELLAWLQRGGSIVHNATVSRPNSEVEHTLRATNDAQHTSRESRAHGSSTTVPGLAERRAERGELKETMIASPPSLGQGINLWHSSKPQARIKQAGGCANGTALQFAADKKARGRMHEQLNSLKQRSLIDPKATFEHLMTWKQANALAGEEWHDTLTRVVGERARRHMDETIPEPVKILSRQDLESSEPRNQLEWVKKQGLLTLDKSVQDMHHWREANAKVGESFADFAMRMVNSPPVPSQTQKDLFNKLRSCGLLHRGATFADMQRWMEANAKEGESLKAVVKRLTAGHVRKQAGSQGNLEMLAEAERDHAKGTLKDESREADQGESSSEDEDVEFILE